MSVKIISNLASKMGGISSIVGDRDALADVVAHHGPDEVDDAAARYHEAVYVSSGDVAPPAPGVPWEPDFGPLPPWHGDDAVTGTQSSSSESNWASPAGGGGGAPPKALRDMSDDELIAAGQRQIAAIRNIIARGIARTTKAQRIQEVKPRAKALLRMMSETGGRVETAEIRQLRLDIEQVLDEAQTAGVFFGQ